MTLAERWVRFITSSAEPWPTWGLLAVPLGFTIYDMASGNLSAAIPFIIISALYWERLGAARLLARQDAELTRLRSASLEQ